MVLFTPALTVYFEYLLNTSVYSSIFHDGWMFLFSFTGMFQSADIPETLVKTLLDEVGIVLACESVFAAIW